MTDIVEVLVPTEPSIIEVLYRGEQGPAGVADTTDTVATGEATSFGPSKNFVRVAGYGAAGDGGGTLYKRAASEPSHDGKFQSADGAWWEMDLKRTEIHVGMFGEIGGANASPAIKSMVGAVGYFRLPKGTFTVQDPILIPAAGVAPNNLFSGQSKEQSILVASGMAGTSVIKPDAAGGLYRVQMRDFGISGDADSAIDFTLSSGVLYESHFMNLLLSSIAGPALKATSSFASTFQGLALYSDNNHSIYLDGGNSTLLIGCYAHECGTAFAGFRIEGHATLVGCLGVDDTDSSYWGWFGKASTSIYQIEIIGGNAEDWGVAAIALEYSGQISINNLAIVSKATGTYETLIKTLSGDTHRMVLGVGIRATTKGSTRSGNSNIQGTGATVLVFNNSESSVGVFPDFYKTTASLLYNVPNLQVRDDGFGATALQITRSHSLRETGFIKPTITTITANATTFVVTSMNAVTTANSVATSLAQLTGGESGQELLLMIGDANTTIKHNTGGSGRFLLKSAADETPANGAVYKFVLSASIWRQI